MSGKTLKDISPASFAVLSALTGISWGAVAGLSVFVAVLLSDSVAAMLPKDGIAGIPPGVALLFLIPATLGAAGYLAGYLSYPIFSLLIGAVGGVHIEAEIASDVTAPPGEAASLRSGPASPAFQRRGL
ncbi:MAG TPA: hypothetical protein PKI32_04960 [Opitutales bacterium]|nr:hypothetical protein [Opitutales bacterium]